MDLLGAGIHRRSISREEKAQISKVFKDCDENGKGFLDHEDIKVAIINLFGYKPSKYEVDQIMGVNQKNSPGLSLEKFQSLMESKLSLEDADQECRQIFDMFDIHCKGFLTSQDLITGFSSIVPNLSKDTVFSCFKFLDKDGDGRISFRDFEYCMKFET